MIGADVRPDWSPSITERLVSCASERSRPQRQGIEQRVRNPSQVLVIVKGSGKSSLENTNGFFDFRLSHDIDRSLWIAAMRPHSNEPPEHNS
jgi:hypothetical protein